MTIESSYIPISTEEVQHSPLGRISRDHEKSDAFISRGDEYIDKVEDPAPNPDSLLTAQEQATLHLLFGVGETTERSFYGNSKIQQIHKGYLVDITS
jgi:hypothetical protein